MKFIPIRFKDYKGFDIRKVKIEKLTIFAFRLGFVGFQISYGSLSDETMASIKRGVEDMKAGRVVPWSEVKKNV